MEVIMNTFDEEKDYLDFLGELIYSAFRLRKDFCREVGITESSLSYFLNGKKRLPHVEQVILDYFEIKKEVITTIKTIRPAD